MKFCLVSLGVNPVPPKGWGAIEIIIWDYKHYLEALGHQVHVINTVDRKVIESEINAFSPDVCHCHFDGYWNILERCNANLKLMTSHCGSIRGDMEDVADFRDNILPRLNSKVFYNFCLDPFIRDRYLSLGFDPARLFVVPNAARADLIRFAKIPRTHDTVCVGKIQTRKRQYLLENLNVFFIGDFGEGTFNRANKRLIGMWDKEKLYADLTDNANLVLLSKSEAAPLVVLEAMMAGLGIVISETCIANLDLSLPFIDVIPEKYITNPDYVTHVLGRNKRVSLPIRNQIRKYAEEHHSYELTIGKYLKTIQTIFESENRP